ncbi:AsnC family protein [Hazenella sp. IB182353]|uniref:AsnC family protein n=1 Tax=Polycladospora coralii TaxID=2771432 RepID=UPI001BCB05D7|nr:AsnC family protein [Polycladospora coralii]MBS7531865.1 AsnC family protein [Polycladospora coralii]
MSTLVQAKQLELELWHDCYLSERKKTGFVATLEMPGGFQRYWGLNDIQKMLTHAESKHESDMYLSLNAFKYGSRKETALKQIRNIGLDLDIYKMGATLAEATDEVQALVLDRILPEPNLVIGSGRGLQLIYGIEGGASPQMVWMSRYITAQYTMKLGFLGADTQTTDPTRVLRFPNTINQKNQVKATVDIWNNIEYALPTLYSYCTPVEETRKSRRKIKREIVTLPPPKGIVNLYSLNTKKKDDLELLVTLRNGQMVGYRNTYLYTYCFTVALIVKEQASTIVFARQINEKFTESLLIKEVIEVAKSACKDALAFLKAFSENEYTMRGLKSDLIKPEKASTIVRKLEMTSDEGQQMRVLIDQDIRRDRNTELVREKRREEGVKPRQEYEKVRKAKVDDKLDVLRMAIVENPNASNSQLSNITGIPRTTVIRLKKRIT